ncbi:hypothetical protein A3C09_04030 [Candidatus Uhrbacteria bacterium RIFCSPHIGHO2_02_FULL_47_44]|uniref:O-antigen ligase-related domain-containing protein n=1 Tax=Candidatus Uhrbacteria bacterium RIFCSPLOWO2_02_FULL_48_18 TaxID=1802408 RepID=A0A1F7V7Q2_9BACT|nr:MAG: hypothetical protein A2839_01555 [Candidatus Uhrbacteria bacterium RIFCSPHIGHO2_01_FULL_47_10]OGL71077.1 MAG: hypothetical protein A3C09_04030 [Candidatus Uhrbacteria bacterium RIFCSPHIGHO2_02_FULL_47_44]OGL80814.1 MAG: hypothetical protein A3B20_05540 [Candidatus Uhrbacteria bacterium RIFCSPLOWO2_01_FULL_47_17]OGL86533.1 MAG: hypothetical protein A3I41_04565 [Candidatus Uhrbacteria bacterium RIFCSPLOWO2_02_FULL_48_18]OGL92825.1 MAG: hypothetical protein A3H12_02905 [Candidatus Uhrbacte
MFKLHFFGVLRTLMFTLLLLPIVFDPALWRPAQTSKYLFFIVLVPIIFIILVSFVQKIPWKQLFQNPIFFLYGLYVLYVGISSLFGVDLLNSYLGNDSRIGGWFLLFLSWLFCGLLVVLFSARDWNLAHKFYIYGAVFISLYAILESLRLVPTFGLDLPRASSLIGNPVYLGGYLVLPTTLLLSQIHFSEWKKHLSKIVCLFILSGGFIAAGTRGVYVGFVAGLFFYGFIALKKRFTVKKQLFITFFIIVVLLSLFGLGRKFVPEGTYAHRFFDFSDTSSNSRLEFWKMGVRSVGTVGFFGVGHENYYRVAEQYYSGTLYGAEGTYSDKPHNIYVEILVCSGVLGLMFYLGCIACVIYRLFREYKKKENKHFLILLSGFLVYLVQNFFAFESVSTLFVFSYFLAYVISFDVASSIDRHTEKRKRYISWLLMIGCFVLYSMFISRFVIPTNNYFRLLSVAKQQTDATKQLEVMKRIEKQSFIFDRDPLAKMYHASAKTFYNKDGNTADVQEFIQSAIYQYDRLLELHPKRGEFWYQRADMGLMLAFLNKTAPDQRTKIAIEKAIEFTPTRTEPYIVKATELEMAGKIPEGIQILEDIRQKIPNSTKLLWTLSILYIKNGQEAKGAELGYQAIDMGLKVAGVQSILDLINYYAEQKDYKKVIRLYERAVNLFPKQVDLYANLAAAYAVNGQNQEAIITAKKYAELNPQAKAETEAFIQSLP